MQKSIAIVLALTVCCALITGCQTSAERKLEQASQLVDEIEAAERVQEEADTLEEMLAEIDRLQEKIAILAPGTTAYQEAVEENNRLIEQLVENYPEFADFVEEK